MSRQFLFVAGLLALLSLGCDAHAQSPQFLGNFRDWYLYAYDDSGGKTCYIASKPTAEEGNYRRRGPSAVLVARLPIAGAGEQVSVQPGYGFKPGSTVEVKIGKRRWDFFTQGEHAWANTDEEDKQVIAAMKDGTEMTVRGTSTLDTYSLDTFSLLGFTAALEALRDACPG